MNAPPVAEPGPAEPKGQRALKVLKSLLVGAGATAVDTAVLELLTRGVGLSPTRAKVFSLLCGVSVQFVGSRYFAFKAHRGLLTRQLKWFALCEVITFVLSVAVFHGLYWLAQHFARVISIELAQFLSGAIVYFGFSYPVWNRVFKLTPEEQAEADGALKA